ncbi:MAG: membrane-bound lytic murein transglycosylase MltF [SAR324 cluster bacterium]|nr:membrane-bound lytic murein transglycosylase MltF [SAR324 cluster bacterium]
MELKRYRIFLSLLILLLVGGIVLYLIFYSSQSLDRMRQKGKIVVLTRNAPITYYIDVDDAAGFEFDLVQAFAQHLGVKAEFKILDSVAEIIEAMENGEGDLAAASLTVTEEREKSFVFGPSYMTIQQQVVCRKGGFIPDSIEELGNVELLVIDKSSYVERLQELKTEGNNLRWKTTRETDTENILQMVWEKKVECTVADSNIVAINRRYYPELVVAFPITSEQSLAWIINDQHRPLFRAVNKWLKAFEKKGDLAVLKERYYGHVDVFDYVDLAVYHRHMDQRLPKYRHLFERAGKKNDIPWEILAAQSYQESHWDPRAKSPTGVRGLMMLTKKTAKSLKVKNRLNPQQSIMGGAKYLKKLLKRVPDDVEPSDRLYYALAAYNVGMGHIHDAQTLAREFGKNPNSWQELKEILPLLSQKKYYKKLKYGYARGNEPVRYVDRILNYHDILKKIL